MFAETALQCFQSSYLHSQRRVHYFSHNPRKHITIDKTLKSAPTPYNCDICQRMNRLEEVRILPLTSLLPSDVQVQPTVTRSETRGCACVHYLKREAREERNMVSRFGLAVRRYRLVSRGPRFESASALFSLQKLWSVDTVL